MKKINSNKDRKTAVPACQSAAPCYAFYSISETGNVLMDGHTMFINDIARGLNRKSYLEKEYVKLRYREKVCPTMLESESRALLKALQEIAECVGLDSSNSPSETVEKVRGLVV